MTEPLDLSMVPRAITAAVLRRYHAMPLEWIAQQALATCTSLGLDADELSCRADAGAPLVDDLELAVVDCYLSDLVERRLVHTLESVVDALGGSGSLPVAPAASAA